MPKLREFSESFGCGNDSFSKFGRSIYKYTPCGPWLVAVLLDGDEVYYEDGKADTIKPDTEIAAIKVGSIVEGWDCDGVGPILVQDPKNLAEAITDVNDAASAIWEEVNESEEPNDELCGSIASGIYRPGGY
jgi:hypothetical protein